jgi:hypothetical protein
MSASIFISHSAKDAPALVYLDAIAGGLLAAKFDVWVDRTRPHATRPRFLRSFVLNAFPRALRPTPCLG